MTALKRKLDLALNTKKKKLHEDLNPILPHLTLQRLTREYFNVSCHTLANFLLGKLIVRHIENDLLKGRIIETECYLGGEDKASHSYNGRFICRRTPTNEAMYMEPGTAYVYKIYGMYHCFNISAIEPGGAVLIRALEPINGIDKMLELRSNFRAKEVNLRELCKGPSKLCISMNITKENANKVDLCNNTNLWIEFDNDFQTPIEIIDTTRIGISSAGEEWANKLLRFYVKDNLYVSKRNHKREKDLVS